MAGVSSEQGSNSLDVELNLVPFIDLLSTLVLFLLVTAVWLQIAAIPASVQSKGKSTTSNTNDAKLTVHMTEKAIQITGPAWAGLPGAIPRGAGGYNFDLLVGSLRKASTKQKLPMATVSADDGVPYGQVVQAVDSIKLIEGQLVGLSTN